MIALLEMRSVDEHLHYPHVHMLFKLLDAAFLSERCRMQTLLGRVT